MPLLCSSDHADNLKRVLRKPANVEQKDEKGNTGLMIAASKGNTALMELLIDAKASVGTRNNDGHTALSLAALANQIQPVRLLLAHSADPLASPGAGVADKRTALEIATFYEHRDIETLMVQDAMLQCCDNGKTKLLLQLLARSPRPNLEQASANGATLLMIAAKRGHCDILKLLLEANANPNAENNLGATALSVAALNGRVDVCRLLLDGRASHEAGKNAVFSAASAGKSEMVHWLLKDRRDPNRAFHSSTPLHTAAHNGHTDTVRVLLRSRADPSLTDKSGMTPKRMAELKGHAAVVAVLVEHEQKEARKVCALCGVGNSAQLKLKSVSWLPARSLLH